VSEQLVVMSADAIELKIATIRGERVLLDSDLAAMYGVETKALVQAVNRNLERFPDDFMFRLTSEEWAGLRPATEGRGGRRTLPLVFTQEGVAMLSSVLRSDRAVQVNIQIMRAFVKMRELLGAQVEFARRLDDLEAKYDEQFAVVFSAIRQLMAPPALPPKRPLGFRAPEEP
jgi:hypothetical protein